MINVIYFYRLARYLHGRSIPLLPKIVQGIIFLFYNCHVSYLAQIGKGTYFLHKGMATLILDHVVIGEDCRIGMNVMITGKAPYKEVARIGNKVYIGPGAVISGPIIIEDNVIVAPNSMLLKSVPKNKIVAGNPARIIGDVTKLNYDIFKNPDFKLGFMPFLESEVR